MPGRSEVRNRVRHLGHKIFKGTHFEVTEVQTQQKRELLLSRVEAPKTWEVDPGEEWLHEERRGCIYGALRKPRECSSWAVPKEWAPRFPPHGAGR